MDEPRRGALVRELNTELSDALGIGPESGSLLQCEIGLSGERIPCSQGYGES